MAFLIRKAIESLLMPVGLCVLLTIFGATLRRRWLACVGAAILYLFSTSLVSTIVIRGLEDVWPAKTVAAAPTADAIVVLSGSIVRGVAPPGVQWGDACNRYFAGVDLALAGKAPLLVLSAGAPPAPKHQGEGAILRRIAIDSGLSVERVVLTRSVLTTEDESRAVSEIHGIHSILLVTSAFHMPRASMLFRARGFEVSPFPVDQRVLEELRITPFQILPESTALHESEMALREYYGLGVYRILLFFRPAGF